jgi:hypothetical protein
MFKGMIFLFPACLMAMTMGNMLIGEEGASVWRIYASPITPKNLVKAKLALQVSFSVVVLIVTGSVGVLIYQPSLKFIIVATLEALFLIAALSGIALAIGFKGADFTATRRARMIRQEWSLISLVGCGLAGLGILAPLAPYVISTFLPSNFALFANSLSDLILPVAISGVIAAAITVIFYKINLNSARELILKAET